MFHYYSNREDTTMKTAIEFLLVAANPAVILLLVAAVGAATHVERDR